MDNSRTKPDLIPETSVPEEKDEERNWRSVVIMGLERKIDLKVIEPYKKVTFPVICFFTIVLGSKLIIGCRYFHTVVTKATIARRPLLCLALVFCQIEVASITTTSWSISFCKFVTTCALSDLYLFCTDYLKGTC